MIGTLSLWTQWSDSHSNRLMSSQTVKLRTQEQVQLQPHSQCMFLKQRAQSHVLIHELGCCVTRVHQQSLHVLTVSLLLWIQEPLSPFLFAPTVPLRAVGLESSSQGGGRREIASSQGCCFCRMILRATTGGLQKRVGKSMTKESRRQKHWKSEVSSDKWFTLILALFLIKGWDSWARRLGSKIRAVHLQEHFTQPASSVLERTFGTSNPAALVLTEFLVQETSSGKIWKRHTGQHEHSRQSKQQLVLGKFLCCSWVMHF